ncbi:hypothetical protein ACFFF5_06400 [Lederbergia wuyishanensis]|uniref:Uncharacterized protein n=1 Tax=Lederbergia wuyishanensis TaxID=1347903 RepID=A0ABU0D2X6_9BACI|nr:hypothetical protein [Lederbergia wuyishanensis]MCJ8007120.1 hypothetical protein [Lederbergia wuyishanensis]MDQ0342735.1 hypothetical protein [Lederbergia wuyishanensis]
MNSNKIDYDLKNHFQKEQIEIHPLVKQRMLNTLENLPERQKAKLHFSFSTFKYVAGSIVCLLLAFVTIFHFISNQNQSGNNYVIPDDMTTVQNSTETFTTVMPKSWETINLGYDPKLVIDMVPHDNSASITVSEGVFYITTGGGEENTRNILMENFEASDSYQDFVDKMVDYHNQSGSSIEEIDKVEDIPIFMRKIDDQITLMAYPVVDKKPFAILIQSFEVNTVEKLIEEGYYHYFKQAIQLTHPN